MPNENVEKRRMIIENDIRELLLEFHKTIIEKENPETWFNNTQASIYTNKLLSLLKQNDRLKVPIRTYGKS